MQTRNTKVDSQKNKKSQDFNADQNIVQDNQLHQIESNILLNKQDLETSFGEYSKSQKKDQNYTQQNSQEVPSSKQIYKDLQRKVSQIVNKRDQQQQNGADDQFNTFQKQRKRDSVQSNSTHKSELNDQVNLDYNLNKNIIKARQSIFRAQQAFQNNETKNQGELVIENERLKTTLLVLNQKVKDQDDWEDQIKKLRARNFEIEEQLNIDKSQIQYLDAENSQLKNQIEELNQDLVDLRKQSEKELSNFRQKSNQEINDLKQKHEFEIQELKQKNSLKINDLKQKKEIEINDIIQKNENEINELKQKNENQINDLKQKNEIKINELKQKNENEINELKQKNEIKINDIKQKNDIKIDELKKKNEIEINEINQKNSQKINNVKQKKDNEISDLKQKYDQEISDLKKQSQQEIDDLKKQLNSTKKENQDYKQENSNLKSEILSLKSQLQTTLNNLENYKQRYNELNQQHEEVHDQKINIKYDNEDLNSKIISLEEDLYESKTIQLDLLEQLKLLESQLHQAESKIQELLEQNEQLAKMQAIYIGHRKDKVDIVLGNFINTYPEREKMKIVFLRESEGVYQFGQKRVYIKIGKGNQLIVRVGGGYMLIQDFIEQYTAQEVERIQRKDVISRFQNKLTLQNITTKADFSYEVSPVRSPQRKDQALSGSKSPTRSPSKIGIKIAGSPQHKSSQKKSLNNSPMK